MTMVLIKMLVSSLQKLASIVRKERKGIKPPELLWLHLYFETHLHSVIVVSYGPERVNIQPWNI